MTFPLMLTFVDFRILFLNIFHEKYEPQVGVSLYDEA